MSYLSDLKEERQRRRDAEIEGHVQDSQTGDPDINRKDTYIENGEERAKPEPKKWYE